MTSLTIFFINTRVSSQEQCYVQRLDRTCLGSTTTDKEMEGHSFTTLLLVPSFLRDDSKQYTQGICFLLKTRSRQPEKGGCWIDRLSQKLLVLKDTETQEYWLIKSYMRLIYCTCHTHGMTEELTFLCFHCSYGNIQTYGGFLIGGILCLVFCYGNLWLLLLWWKEKANA